MGNAGFTYLPASALESLKGIELVARSLVEEGVVPYERYTWLKQKPVRLYLYTPKDPGAEIEIVGTDHIRNRDFRVVTRIER